jgi:fatty acid-binding protein DegV
MGRNGLMVNVGQVKGRKKALRTIVDNVVENIEHPEDQEIVIMQADVEDEANRVRDALFEHIPGLKSVRVQAIGPVIGAHCGPGTLAITFLGKERKY